MPDQKYATQECMLDLCADCPSFEALRGLDALVLVILSEPLPVPLCYEALISGGPCFRPAGSARRAGGAPVCPTTGPVLPTTTFDQLTTFDQWSNGHGWTRVDINGACGSWLGAAARDERDAARAAGARARRLRAWREAAEQAAAPPFTGCQRVGRHGSRGGPGEAPGPAPGLGPHMRGVRFQDLARAWRARRRLRCGPHASRAGCRRCAEEAPAQQRLRARLGLVTAQTAGLRAAAPGGGPRPPPRRAAAAQVQAARALGGSGGER